MSTKNTIDCGDGWHLYAEALDGDFVYLDAKGAEWVESFGSKFFREQTLKESGIEVTEKQMVLKIPRKLAERIFNDDEEYIVDGTPLKNHTL